MDFNEKVKEINSLLEQHNTFRGDCLNLIASENVPSPLVEGLLVEDLDQRYGNYTGIDLRARSYQGNRFHCPDRGVGAGTGKATLRCSVC